MSSIPSPMHATPSAPERGVIQELDRIWHRDGPLTASDLRSLNTISQSIVDVYEALGMLARMAADEVEELENIGAQDPAKKTRVVQARYVMARFDDLAIERQDPEDVAESGLEWSEEPQGLRP